MELSKDVTETISCLMSGDKTTSLGDVFEQIDMQQKIVQEKLHNLIFSNYKTFLEASNNAENIKNDLEQIKCLTKPLSEFFPSFQKICDDFFQKGKDISNNHNHAKLALSKYPKLLEILEIPQLMDTCVKNAHYEAALQLSDFVMKTQMLFPDIDLLKVIQCDIEKSLNNMLQALLAKLKMDSQLPTTINTIGLIRRMNVYSEDELRAIFLQCRSLWLRKEIKNALSKWLTQSATGPEPSHNYYFALNKVTECYRVHLFDSITQYSAMFSTSHVPKDTQNYEPVDDDLMGLLPPANTYNRLFDSWLIFELNGLFEILRGLLERVRDFPSVFKSLLDQFSYLGSSLSRVKADAKPLLTQLLVDFLEKSLDRQLSLIPVKFAQNLEKHGASNSLKLIAPISSHEANFSPPSDQVFNSTGHARKQLSLNSVLLAVHNDFAKTYNAIDSDCSRPLSLYPFCVDKTVEVLKACSLTLNDYIGKQNFRLNLQEKRTVFDEISKAFVDLLVPTIFQYLEDLYPQICVEQTLGISVLNPCQMIPSMENNISKFMLELPISVKSLAL